MSMPDPTQHPFKQTPLIKLYQTIGLNDLPIDDDLKRLIQDRIRNELWDLAAGSCQLALRKPGAPVELFFFLGKNRFRMWQLEQAHAAFHSATDRAPGYAEAYSWLGITCFHLGDLDEAEQHLQVAISLDPSDSLTWKSLGLSLSKRGKRPACIAALEQAVKLSPHNQSLKRLLNHVRLGGEWK